MSKWKCSKFVTSIALFVGVITGIVVIEVDKLVKHPLITFGFCCLGLGLVYGFDIVISKAIKWDLNES